MKCFALRVSLMQVGLVSVTLSISCNMLAAVLVLPGCQKKLEYQPPADAIPDIPPGRGISPTDESPAYGNPEYQEVNQGRVVAPP